MSVKESAEYDNYMDQQKRTEDSYSVGLDKFFDEPVQPVLYDQTKAKKKNQDAWKVLYVHFRERSDMAEFCRLINQMIPHNIKETWYPLHDPDASLFGFDDEDEVFVDENLLAPRSKDYGETKLDIDVDVKTHDDYKWRQYWLGMPEYVQENKDN